MRMRKRLLVLAFAMMLLCSMGLTAYAHPVPDAEQKGSIVVTMRYGESTVAGGSLTLYQVGKVYGWNNEDDGDYSFKLTEAFEDSGVELSDLGEDAVSELAKQLAEYVSIKRPANAGSVNIDNDGKATFTGLDLGLYLVVQERAASGYNKISPFLVSVPMLSETGDAYIYDVDASPKVEELTKAPVNPDPDPDHPSDPENPDDSTDPVKPVVTTKTPEPAVPVVPILPVPDASANTLPQTGQLNWPVPVLVVFGLGLFSAGWMLRYGKKKDENAK